MSVQQPSYARFLVFLAGITNKTKREIQHSLFFRHKVRKKESLLFLSRKYNINERKICQYNRLKNNYLKIGQVLKIPISNSKKAELFQNKVRPIAENLNYPPKFNAVYELVNNTLAWKQEAKRYV